MPEQATDSACPRPARITHTIPRSVKPSGANPTTTITDTVVRPATARSVLMRGEDGSARSGSGGSIYPEAWREMSAV